MASNTRRLKVRRALSKARAGKTRKAHVRNHGTTKPLLPLNKPNANEQKQAQAKSK